MRTSEDAADPSRKTCGAGVKVEGMDDPGERAQRRQAEEAQREYTRRRKQERQRMRQEAKHPGGVVVVCEFELVRSTAALKGALFSNS